MLKRIPETDADSCDSTQAPADTSSHLFGHNSYKYFSIWRNKFTGRSDQRVVAGSTLETETTADCTKPTVDSTGSQQLLHEDKVMPKEDKVVLQEDRVMLQEDKVVLQEDKVVLQEDRVMLQEDKVILQEDKVMLQEKVTLQEKVMLQEKVTLKEGRVLLQQDRLADGMADLTQYYHQLTPCTDETPRHDPPLEDRSLCLIEVAEAVFPSGQKKNSLASENCDTKDLHKDVAMDSKLSTVSSVGIGNEAERVEGFTARSITPTLVPMSIVGLAKGCQEDADLALNIKVDIKLASLKRMSEVCAQQRDLQSCSCLVGKSSHVKDVLTEVSAISSLDTVKTSLPTLHAGQHLWLSDSLLGESRRTASHDAQLSEASHYSTVMTPDPPRMKQESSSHPPVKVIPGLSGCEYDSTDEDVPVNLHVRLDEMLKRKLDIMKSTTVCGEQGQFVGGETVGSGGAGSQQEVLLQQNVVHAKLGVNRDKLDAAVSIWEEDNDSTICCDKKLDDCINEKDGPLFQTCLHGSDCIKAEMSVEEDSSRDVTESQATSLLKLITTDTKHYYQIAFVDSSSSTEDLSNTDPHSEFGSFQHTSATLPRIKSVSGQKNLVGGKENINLLALPLQKTENLSSPQNSFFTNTEGSFNSPGGCTGYTPPFTASNNVAPWNEHIIKEHSMCPDTLRTGDLNDERQMTAITEDLSPSLRLHNMVTGQAHKAAGSEIITNSSGHRRPVLKPRPAGKDLNKVLEGTKNNLTEGHCSLLESQNMAEEARTSILGANNYSSSPECLLEKDDPKSAFLGQSQTQATHHHKPSLLLSTRWSLDCVRFTKGEKGQSMNETESSLSNSTVTLDIDHRQRFEDKNVHRKAARTKSDINDGGSWTLKDFVSLLLPQTVQMLASHTKSYINSCVQSKPSDKHLEEIHKIVLDSLSKEDYHNLFKKSSEGSPVDIVRWQGDLTPQSDNDCVCSQTSTNVDEVKLPQSDVVCSRRDTSDQTPLLLQLKDVKHVDNPGLTSTAEDMLHESLGVSHRPTSVHRVIHDSDMAILEQHFQTVLQDILTKGSRNLKKVGEGVPSPSKAERQEAQQVASPRSWDITSPSEEGEKDKSMSLHDAMLSRLQLSVPVLAKSQSKSASAQISNDVSLEHGNSWTLSAESLHSKSSSSKLEDMNEESFKSCEDSIQKVEGTSEVMGVDSNSTIIHSAKSAGILQEQPAFNLQACLAHRRSCVRTVQDDDELQSSSSQDEGDA